MQQIHKSISSWLIPLGLLVALVLAAFPGRGSAQPAAGSADPPASPVKLIFIHHSTGENWLSDGYGDLGLALAQNNYFVSDTNYGWGPDSIGDRTDIPDWPEWFRSAQTPRYMEALFNESDQHASYTRTFADPGGENQIVLFKSCFPNSDLYGSPDDAPTPEADFTVGHAKWVYNEILDYFATRPDKLFVVITAPALSAPAIPENARAFNQWLVNDWLRENAYPYQNVAVFDFYNILTGPDAHHWLEDGQVAHVVGSRDTLYYPSDDDHPSVEGSRKATAEFVPLLNLFYHNWQDNLAAQPPAGTAPTVVPEAAASAAPEVATEPPAAAAAAPAALIDDFEGPPAGSSSGWQAFWDEGTPTQISCAPGRAPAGDGAALQMDFDVAANAWATCALFFDAAQAWAAADGLTFRLQAATAGLVFNVDLYAGPEEARESYVYTVEAPPDSVGGWVPIRLAWADFHRVEWEENAGAPFADPGRVSGLAFGFETFPDAANSGTIWVDDLGLAVGEATAPAAALPTNAPAPESTAAPADAGGGGPCPAGGLALGLVLVPLFRRRKQ